MITWVTCSRTHTKNKEHTERDKCLHTNLPVGYGSGGKFAFELSKFPSRVKKKPPLFTPQKLKVIHVILYHYYDYVEKKPEYKMLLLCIFYTELKIIKKKKQKNKKK